MHGDTPFAPRPSFAGSNALKYGREKSAVNHWKTVAGAKQAGEKLRLASGPDFTGCGKTQALYQARLLVGPYLMPLMSASAPEVRFFRRVRPSGRT